MSDPLYGPNAGTADSSPPEAVSEPEVDDGAQRQHDAPVYRSQVRAPRDRSLRKPRRDR